MVEKWEYDGGLARARAVLPSLSLVIAAALPANAASHPPGVTYPLAPAAVQPAGLAQPLPSTRRYVLVWKDQLADAVQGISDAQKDFIVTHYVGSQKLFKSQIDEYRQKNPNFLTLVYHLAYGLNGSDQTNPVGNITGPDQYGQEDEDTFSPYVALHSLTRENAYQHSSEPGSSANRVSYPDPYWLMDIASTEWRGYLYDTLVEWQGYAETKATGVFLDVAFFPWYSYTPDGWWAGPAGDSSRTALRDFWNPLAADYYDGMRAAFAKTAEHPRYLVIPNTDALIDGTDEPAFLSGTDGVFTENWQRILSGPGDWNLSARRIEKYATSVGKVWLTDVTQAGTDLTALERELLIGTYLLLRNGTSYIMFGNDDVSWYPEYELDVGAYDDEPPSDLEELRVAGDGGSSGGLYLRSHAAGLVLVNSSDGALSYALSKEMRRASFSGGGEVTTAGVLPAFTLDYDTVVPAGDFSVPARSMAVLREPDGAPPAGEEPGVPGSGAGGVAGASGTDGGSASATGGMSAGGSSTGAGTGSGARSGGAGRGGAVSGGAGGVSGATGGIGNAANAGAGAALGGTGATSGGAPSGKPLSSGNAKEEGGCGCRVARSGDHGGWLSAALALGLFAARRRHRAVATVAAASL